jgi:hypothetical protein
MGCTELHTTVGAGRKYAGQSLMFFNDEQVAIGKSNVIVPESIVEIASE